MNRMRWIGLLFPAMLLLLLSPRVLQSRVDEQNVTTRLLLGSVLYARDDQPAEQVSVELWTAEGAPVATTVTSWGGEFHFEQVDPGEYLISVEEPGCEPVWQKVHAPLEDRLTVHLKRNDSAGARTVSVHDLSIPPKAREALRDGIQLLKTDLPRAMADLQRAVDIYPDYYEAYHVLGMANLMMERLPDAEEAFRQSIEHSDRRYARPLLALGAVLCDQENFVEAESVIREGLAIDNTPWIGHLLLARVLFAQNRWDEAEQNALEAVVRQPEVADAYLLLAHIHVRQHKAGAAVRDLDQFLRLDPDGEISAQARKVRDQLWRQDRSVDASQNTLTHP